MGYIYLLHFERPISDKHTCRHYMGWTNDLTARLAQHRAGTGSRLCQVAKERGIGFTLARVWQGDRHLERKLKNRKNGPKLSPCCGHDPLDITVADMPELEF